LRECARVCESVHAGFTQIGHDWLFLSMSVA
jgi:hypothetical protein